MISGDNTRNRVAEVAIQCLLDEDLPLQTPVEDYEDVKLLGSRAICDSLGLVSFLVGFEEGINEAFDAGIVLMNERAMSQERSPFRNLSTIIDYVDELLSAEEKN